jgi:S-adenosylmethionine hydrolase
MEIITLTTDFGELSGYPAAMKGVILSLNPTANIVDITHSIQSQNYRQGAFIMYSVIDFYPESIHIGVVDPGVGTDRAGLIIKSRNGTFVGPDNGLLIPAAKKIGIESVYKITNEEIWLPNVSSTFHGRDIFAPVGAYISKGKPIEELGVRITDFQEFDLFEIEQTQNLMIGYVLNIDKFGNIITNFSNELIEKKFKSHEEIIFLIENNRHSDKIETSINTAKSGFDINFKIPFENSYGDVSIGSMVALISSSGFLEIAGNQINANNRLKLDIGDKIMIQL